MVKELLVQKKFGVEMDGRKFCVRKIYFWMKQINTDDNFFWSKNLFVPKNLVKKIILGQQNFGIKKILGKNYF